MEPENNFLNVHVWRLTGRDKQTLSTLTLDKYLVLSASAEPTVSLGRFALFYERRRDGDDQSKGSLGQRGWGARV